MGAGVGGNGGTADTSVNMGSTNVGSNIGGAGRGKQSVGMN